MRSGVAAVMREGFVVEGREGVVRGRGKGVRKHGVDGDIVVSLRLVGSCCEGLRT